MPYIRKDARDRLFGKNDPDGLEQAPQTSGELNYKFTELIVDYVLDHGESYQVFNDVIGALEGAKLEFYRRKVVPYENVKIEENGDVY